MAQDIQAGYIEQDGVRAPVTSTTYTLDVLCVDSYGNETTFKIDNPKNDVTKAQTETVFNYAINTGHWVSKYGYAYQSIKTVKKVTTVKTVEALE